MSDFTNEKYGNSDPQAGDLRLRVVALLNQLAHGKKGHAARAHLSREVRDSLMPSLWQISGGIRRSQPASDSGSFDLPDPAREPLLMSLQVREWARSISDSVSASARGKAKLLSLRVGGFKAFNACQDFPIRPLTLLFGPNSGGKSSMLHALMYLHHSLGTGDLDPHLVLQSGSEADLGGLLRMTHGRTDGGRITLGATLSDEGHKVDLDFDIGSHHGNLPAIVRFRMTLDGTIVQESEIPSQHSKAAATLMVERKMEEHPEILRVTDQLDQVMSGSVEASSGLENLDSKLSFLARYGLLHLAAVRSMQKRGTLSPSTELGVSGSLFPPLKWRTCNLLDQDGNEHPSTGTTRAAARALQTLHQAIRRFFVLGPLRRVPPREIVVTEVPLSSRKEGEELLWDSIGRDPQLRASINRWLSSTSFRATPYRLDLMKMIVRSELGRTEAQYNTLGLTDLRSGIPLSPRDVGFGISQALPVVAAAHTLQSHTIAVEQPELHLHPALQADLADLFIESAMTRGNTLILETHSEHLVLRILRRIRESHEGRLPSGMPKIGPGDVSIIYVEPGESGSRAIPIQVGEDGELASPWPGGFFPERSAELM